MAAHPTAIHLNHSDIKWGTDIKKNLQIFFFFKRLMMTCPHRWEQKQMQKMTLILQMSYFSFSVENWTDKRHTDHSSWSNGASPWWTQVLTNKKHWVFPGKLQTLVSVHFTVVLKNIQYLKDLISSMHRKLASQFTNCEHSMPTHHINFVPH